MLNNIMKMGKSNLVVENKTINFHELPIGKFNFRTSVSKISFDNKTDAGKQTQFLYLKNLKVRIGDDWYDVECSNNAVRLKMGKKLKELHLKKNDFLTFESHVASKDLEFDKIEGYHTIKSSKQYCEPNAVLPKDYNGDITVYLYNDVFAKHFSCWHNNYVEILDRQTFDKRYETYFNWYISEDGAYEHLIEPHSMFYEGRELKHLSNISSFQVEEGGKK